MNRFLFACVSVAPLFVVMSVSAAPFRNLDFEAAVPPFQPDPLDPYRRIPTSVLLPSWSAFAGTNRITLALYNNLFLDSAGVGLHDAGSTPIEGRYSALIQSGNLLGSILPWPDSLVNTSLSQTGDVPLDARALQLRAIAGGRPGVFTVNLAGQTIDMVPLSSESRVTLYAGDISAFAGRTAELRVTAVDRILQGGDHTYMMLDAITFSPVPVPEPSTLMLLGLAAVLARKFWRSSAARERRTASSQMEPAG